jgi:hypothetical protein
MEHDLNGTLDALPIRNCDRNQFANEKLASGKLFNITMENQHFSWVNPLSMAIFNSYLLVITRGYPLVTWRFHLDSCEILSGQSPEKKTAIQEDAEAISALGHNLSASKRSQNSMRSGYFCRVHLGNPMEIPIPTNSSTASTGRFGSASRRGKRFTRQLPVSDRLFPPILDRCSRTRAALFRESVNRDHISNATWGEAELAEAEWELMGSKMIQMFIDFFLWVS